MDEYKEIKQIVYIKKYCNNSYKDFLEKSKDFESRLIFHAYTNEVQWIDKKNKIIIYDEYSIGD